MCFNQNSWYSPESMTKSINCGQTSLSLTKEQKDDLHSNDLYFDDFT